MRHDRINAAVAEAERFIERVKALKEAEKEDERKRAVFMEKFPERRWYTPGFPREHGAIRRASMDLTRALAAMRRPDHAR